MGKVKSQSRIHVIFTAKLSCYVYMNVMPWYIDLWNRMQLSSILPNVGFGTLQVIQLSTYSNIFRHFLKPILATSLTAATTKKRRIRFKPENERKEDFAAASVIWLCTRTNITCIYRQSFVTNEITFNLLISYFEQ